MDPLIKDYPYYTPYSFAGNKPIWFIDLDGREEKKHWYQYDFNDLMNWLSRSDNSLSSINNGEGPIGKQLDNFNKNVNPVGIIGHGIYSTVTGKDLTTGGSVNRGTAFANMSANIIMTAAGEKLAGAFYSSQAERQMASVTLKPKMQQTAIQTIKVGEQESQAIIRQEVSQGTPVVFKSKATEFLRTETIGGNKAAQTVGADMKILNEGGSLAPIEVASINNKLYVIDGHHRLEAALRMGSEIKYKILTKEQWQSYGYQTEDDIIQAASEAGAQKVKLDSKIIKRASAF